MKEKDVFDVTIIGGGPAGLYSTFYSGLREMKTKLIEYQSKLGGKINVYPEKMIWDVGGVPPIPGEKLMEQLVKQGLTFYPTVVLNEKIESISRNEDGTFLLRAASGQKHYSKTVIIAVGAGILNPKKLEIPGAERFEVANIHYTITSLMKFKNKTVMISGGGNTAIDWANELESIANKVYITYRKELSGHEAQVTQLLNSSVHCLPHTRITKLVASENHEKVKKVELTNQETGENTYIDIDEVIINHGYEQDTSLLKNSELNIEMANDFYIAGNPNSASSIEGLYAAGDILKFDGKLHLIAGCFHDAANAVNQAKHYIQPKAEKFAMVSSHNDIFQKRNRELVKEMIMGNHAVWNHKVVKHADKQ
ncbi:NAD(P)/FAD-dependent oxidoreductase [Oceanobacillus sp. Castelsardo]|uniref:NAD(P)/FAD-dependent oxidoreductase n=1 Tax=Oceanobacillus sp. Castelsardo TaxID=1851204 RepID=UPI0008392A53|nr:NAD(P)/FAD-dependent oxidoreductase [Oceanobacillus sp. Castelsardo]